MLAEVTAGSTKSRTPVGLQKHTYESAGTCPQVTGAEGFHALDSLERMVITLRNTACAELGASMLLLGSGISYSTACAVLTGAVVFGV